MGIQDVFLIIAIVVILFFSFLIFRNNEDTPSDDKKESNQYNVDSPEGKMIDKFGYSKDDEK